MNIMRKSLVIYSFVMFLVVGLYQVVSAEEVVEGTVAAEKQRSLGAMVRDYINRVSAQSLGDLLVQIQSHPDVNLPSVEAAIRGLPQYSSAPVGAQPKRSIKVKGKNTSYSLYVPPSYSPEQSYPLIVCLHGAGFTGESYLERWVSRLEDRYILACPTIAGGAWWTRFAEDVTLGILDSLSQEYHVDPDRVFLTGMSNGGIGAWIIGMHHADRFAGIAPMASGLDDVMFPFVENLINTPVYVIHGQEDQVMPVRLSQDLVREMKRHGVPYQYREHQWTHTHAGGHFFPHQELPKLIAWFDQQRRAPLPTHIAMVRDASHSMPMSWGRIDATDQIAEFSENLVDKRDALIAAAIYAKLHAEVVEPNTIEVRALRVRKYTLFFNDDLVDFSKPIVVKTNGVKSFEGVITPNIETLLQEARQRSSSHVLFPAKISLDVPSSGAAYTNPGKPMQ